VLTSYTMAPNTHFHPTISTTSIRGTQQILQASPESCQPLHPKSRFIHSSWTPPITQSPIHPSPSRLLDSARMKFPVLLLCLLLRPAYLLLLFRLVLQISLTRLRRMSRRRVLRETRSCHRKRPHAKPQTEDDRKHSTFDLRHRSPSLTCRRKVHCTTNMLKRNRKSRIRI
jgi:hypothetical protein